MVCSMGTSVDFGTEMEDEKQLTHTAQHAKGWEVRQPMHSLGIRKGPQA